MNEEIEIKPNEIPEELQREILSWLPSKSLSRFNSVSKQWYHSFTYSAFLLRHSRSLNPTKLFFSLTYLIESQPFDHDEYDSKSDEMETSLYGIVDDIDILPTKKGIRISLSNLPPSYHNHQNVGVSNFCDGLLCFFTGRDYLPCLSMLLYSVRTHEFVLLPTKSVSEMSNNAESEYVYVPRVIMCCLGFDPIGKEYKALRIISGDDCTNEFEILTIGSSKYWRNLKDNDVVVPPSLAKGVPHEGSFCLDGVIYWVNEFVGVSLVKIVIASFDLNRQVFRAFELNEVVGRSYHYRNQYYLTACKGRATLICIDIEGDGEKVVLWLDQRTGVWTPTFEIPTCDLGSDFWFSGYRYVGGKIMVRRVPSALNSMKFHCYDLENAKQWCIRVRDGFQNDQVVEIHNDFECYADSSA